MDGWSVVQALGVPQEEIAEYAASGISAKVAVGAIVFEHSGVVIGAVKATGKALTLLQQGMMGPASKEVLKANCLTVLNSYKGTIGAVPDEVVEFDSGDAEWVNPPEYAPMTKADKSEKATTVPKSDIVKALEKVQAKHGGELMPSKESAKILFANKPVSNHPVKLSMASQCMQPVTGTSSGSIYYVAARLKGLNLAVRVKKAKLSIRAEGDGLAQYKPFLVSLGFSYTEGAYASVHLNVASPILAFRTFGAVLGGLGIHNLLETADMSQLIKEII